MSAATRISLVLLFAVCTGLFIWFLMEDKPAQSQIPAAGGNISVTTDVLSPEGLAKGSLPARGQTLSGPLLLQGAAETAAPGQRGRPIKLSGIEQLIPGESFTFYIPQEDSVYGGRVAEVSDTASGNRIVSGFTRLEGVDYRFLFTVGRQQTFGTIYTPQGRYQLETRSGSGTIVSGQTISEGLDFSQPDYVIPDPRQEPDAASLQGN